MGAAAIIASEVEKGATYEWAVPLEDCDMESVTMTVADQYVTGIRYIYAIGKVGDWICADAPLELSVIIENNDTVALQWYHDIVSVTSSIQLTHIVWYIYP